MPTPTPPGGPSRSDRAGRRLERPREGRWLAGVCAALAHYSGRPVAVVRLAFVLTIPFLGLPLVAYLAGWLILPEEGGRERSRGSILFSGLVSVLLAFGGGLALLTLAAAGAVATVFGLGWGVVVVAAGVLATGVLWMREVNPGWTLLPLAALVLPAAVIASGHAQLDRHIGGIDVAPTNRDELASSYEIGVGTLFIDLRHYRWDDGAVVPLEITGGVGRTIVALPRHRCVAVHVHYDTHAGALKGVADALGVSGDGSAELEVFGRELAGGQGVAATKVHGEDPILSVDYSSQGGELTVRDYPDSIDPRDWSTWPGEFFLYQPRGKHTKAKIRKAHRIDRRLTRGPCAEPGQR